MTNIEMFLDSYNRLDEFMRNKLGCDRSVSHSKLLSMMSKQDNVFSRIETKLQAYRALRNAIVHIHHEGETPIANPNIEVVHDYQRIIQYALKPPLAIDGIAVTNIHSVDWSTTIRQTTDLMHTKGFSIIPIINNDKMEGLFSSWHFQYFLINKNILFNQDMKLIEMYDSLNLNHPIDYIKKNFRIGFCNIHSTIEDIVNCFLDSAKSGHYFKAVYLTPNGVPNENISGVITPHCLPTINPKLLETKLNI